MRSIPLLALLSIIILPMTGCRIVAVTWPHLQWVPVEVYAIDADSGRPIEGAIVHVQNGSRVWDMAQKQGLKDVNEFYFTGPDGHVTASVAIGEPVNIPALGVSAVGYEHFQRNIWNKPEGDYTIDLRDPKQRTVVARIGRNTKQLVRLPKGSAGWLIVHVGGPNPYPGYDFRPTTTLDPVNGLSNTDPYPRIDGKAVPWVPTIRWDEFVMPNGYPLLPTGGDATPAKEVAAWGPLPDLVQQNDPTKAWLVWFIGTREHFQAACRDAQGQELRGSALREHINESMRTRPGLWVHGASELPSAE